MSDRRRLLAGRADGGTVREETIVSVRDEGDRARLREGQARLRERGLLARGEHDGAVPLSDASQRARAQLLAARCSSLETLVEYWSPESPEVDTMIERLAEELGGPAAPA